LAVQHARHVSAERFDEHDEDDEERQDFNPSGEVHENRSGYNQHDAQQLASNPRKRKSIV